MARKGRFSDNPETELDKKRKLNASGIRKTLRIFRYALPYRGAFGLGMFFLIVSTLTTLTFPKLAGEITDAAKGENNWIFNSVNDIALVFLGILLVQSLASFFRVYLFAIVTEKTMADIRTKLYNQVISLPIPFFEKNRVGDLISRINADVAQLETMLSFGLAELFRQISVLLIGVTIILVRYFELSLVMLATFPLMIICAIIFGRFIRKLSKSVQDTLARANTIVEETLQAVQVVKAFTNEWLESMRYRKELDTVVSISLKTAIFRGAFVSFIIFALFGGIVLVLWYGATMIERGDMQTGELVEFILYTIFIGASVAGMGDLYAQLQKTVGASERILEILEEDTEISLLPEQRDAQIAPIRNIRYQSVHFAYPTRTDIEVLQGIDLEIREGQKVALVGHSGAGKSTIVQLLMKFYEISSGRIDIDGLALSDIPTQALRQQIAIVPQEVMLFGGSIRENIAYGKPGASMEEIEAAARKANAYEFIQRFPEQFETIVGDRGVKLSGGQRQRIAIARALLKNPKVLILDEATSSLDAESEKLVQEALDELMQNRTTIVIAHRLATIRKVDKIYVLHQGKIAEAGTHEQLLMQEEGIYHNLIRLQLETQN